MQTCIRGGRVLVDGQLVGTDVTVAGGNGTGSGTGTGTGRAIGTGTGSGTIVAVGAPVPAARTLDARGLLVLPGIVDIHGDAFERQLEPRPGVTFDVDMALEETDRQLIANGITTAYHGVTWSWEPGLRGPEMARTLHAAIRRLRPVLAADTRFHLRHETFNLDAEAEIIGWLAGGEVGCLAFNDHMSGTLKQRHRPDKIARMVERARIGAEEFQALVDRTWARRDEVAGSIARLAAAAIGAGVPLLSHDDTSPEQRAWFRAIGATIAEFPTTVAAAEAAAAVGEATVFGAPNVMRGGSHTGCPGAAEMVARGLCSVLASDYYYPALLAAPFELQAVGVATLGQAWALVSANPAQALGLADRGHIAPGRRADIVLVDGGDGRRPRVVATIVEGRIRLLTEAERLT